ncbi:hypothetical protein M1E17_21990 [Arthrobacter sp. D1-29]
MSSSTDPNDRLPQRAGDENRRAGDETRRAGDENFRRESARDETFAGGQPTRAFDQAPAGAYGEREYVADPDVTDTAAAYPAAADPNLTDRATAVAREKEQFGGIKVGSAFFGWLTATGMSVLLTALVAGAGTAVGLANNTDVNEAVNQVTTNGAVGIVGIIVLLAILFVSYYSGGYVAGRMARFNGAKQGFMVWIWALIAAVAVALLGLIAGQQFNILANLNSFPRIPINEGELTTASIIAAVVVALIALAGAVLGGLAGMHFHRKVDKAGFTPDEAYDET